MKHSEIKHIRTFCDNLFSKPDWREVVTNIDSEVTDFTIDDVRFISSDTIRDVLEDELASDEYMLGVFTSSAIAEATGWPEFLIKAAQEGDQYEAIGAAMTSEHVVELARIYANSDGYGHHFNGYDFSEEELKIGDKMYHVFDNH